MSKISVLKAFDAYPPSYFLNGGRIDDANMADRCVYEKGYNQAIKDFMKYLKHCSTFTDMNGTTRIDNDLLNVLIEQFKN